MLRARVAVERAEDVLVLTCEGRLPLIRAQHYLLCHQLLQLCLLGRRPPLPERAICLQTKVKKQWAKSMTQNEWYDELVNIIRATYAGWPDPKKFGHPIFMYDNPSFHKLSQRDKEALRLDTPMQSLDQLQQPPPYSGDFMQCIEHVHANICNAWYKQRLQRGAAATLQGHREELEYIFQTKVTAQSVSDNVDKLMMLLAHVAVTGTGDYAPLDLV